MFLVVGGLSLAACTLDSDLPGRNGSAAPVTSAVMRSGAGAPDVDAAVGYGESSRISDINGNSGGRAAASADAVSGGIGSGGAFAEGAGNAGGVASNGSGAAGAGGRSAHAGAAGKGSSGVAGAASSGGAAGGAAGAAAKDPPPVLWFSEYVEGSSSNKALEITALGRSVLEGCKVNAYFNGKAEATVVASLSGILEAGQVLTLCSSALQEKLADVCNQVSNLIFNGDDALSLSCDGKLLDVIGQIGVDPGEGWGSDTNNTAEHTLRRQCSVQAGDADGSDAFEPSAQWQAFPSDTFDGLGTRGCSGSP